MLMLACFRGSSTKKIHKYTKMYWDCNAMLMLASLASEDLQLKRYTNIDIEIQKCTKLHVT
jgi:hypothetical protein